MTRLTNLVIILIARNEGFGLMNVESAMNARGNGAQNRLMTMKIKWFMGVWEMRANE